MEAIEHAGIVVILMTGYQIGILGFFNPIYFYFPLFRVFCNQVLQGLSGIGAVRAACQIKSGNFFHVYTLLIFCIGRPDIRSACKLNKRILYIVTIT